ncbi:IclR family transcriptional regulator C-terminal domain-containing protein [Streptomyces sp. NPDC015131]|uniref:IclR family transcriptional regulator domain-containing protein n=1 Tax=Streptomyces sp. NPDC015131 TaxID=3364941 RepID=UPI0036FD706F
MSDVSGYDGPLGDCSEPPVPVGLTELLRELEGPRDFWDRPYGSGDGGAPDEAEEDRGRANSCYRLGTRALRRDELGAAADWLGRAAEQGHPGALFRLAVVVHRRLGPEGREDAEFLVAEAARCGHGDAGALLRAATGGPVPTGAGDREDPEFADEVREALGLPRAVPRPGGVRDAGPYPAGRSAGDSATENRATGAALAGDAMTGGAGAEGAVRNGCPAVPSGRLLVPEEAAARLVSPPSAPGGLWVPPEPHEPPGAGRLWTPAPLRAPSVTDLAQQVPEARESAERWQQAMRALDVLHALGGADGPMSPAQLARGTGLEAASLERLLEWLSGQGLVSVPEPGAYTAGPLLCAWTRHEGADREDAFREVLSGLRDEVGAAVYVGRYTDGEVRITQYAAGPRTPAVREHVDFREAAHASALGKSLLAQLDFEGRMDHLHRHRPLRLTSRTITDHARLFRTLDHHGPQAAQFDLLEYADTEVCVAFPLTVAGRAGCVALSLPVSRRHRLLDAAKALSGRSANLLATLLLAEDPPPGAGRDRGTEEQAEACAATGRPPSG